MAKARMEYGTNLIHSSVNPDLRALCSTSAGCLLVKSRKAFHDVRIGKGIRDLQTHLTIFGQKSSTPCRPVGDLAYEVRNLQCLLLTPIGSWC